MNLFFKNFDLVIDSVFHYFSLPFVHFFLLFNFGLENELLAIKILEGLGYFFFVIVDPASNNLTNSLLFGGPDVLDGWGLGVNSFDSFFKPPLDFFHFLFHGLQLLGAEKLQCEELFFGLFETILPGFILFDIGKFKGEFLDSIWEFKGHYYFMI